MPDGPEIGYRAQKGLIAHDEDIVIPATAPWPGDLIWMGTDGASPDLRAGDVVEIEISGIGTLRNRFVAEKRTGSRPLT